MPIEIESLGRTIKLYFIERWSVLYLTDIFEEPENKKYYSGLPGFDNFKRARLIGNIFEVPEGSVLLNNENESLMIISLQHINMGDIAVQASRFVYEHAKEETFCLRMGLVKHLTNAIYHSYIQETEHLITKAVQK